MKNYKIITGDLNLYNRLCTLFTKGPFQFQYDPFSGNLVYIVQSGSFYGGQPHRSDFFYNMGDEEVKTFFYKTCGIKAACKHDIIDNGTRVSECRKCTMRMELHGFDWVEAPRKEEPREKPAVAAKALAKKKKVASKRDTFLKQIRDSAVAGGLPPDRVDSLVKQYAEAFDKAAATKKRIDDAAAAGRPIVGYSGKYPNGQIVYGGTTKGTLSGGSGNIQSIPKGDGDAD